jgi:hypothetical protein
MRRLAALFVLAACASAPPPKKAADPKVLNPGEDADPDDPMVQLQNFCTANPCRHDVSVNVRRSGKPPLVKKFELVAPAVQPPNRDEPAGRVTLYAGDTINVEAELVGNEVHLLRAVDKIEHPERTFVLSLTQDEGSVAMTLKMQNPFVGVPIKFQYFPLFADRITARVVQTPSCPVMPGIVNYANWPDPIAVMVLTKPRVLPAGDPLKCD